MLFRSALLRATVVQRSVGLALRRPSLAMSTAAGFPEGYEPPKVWAYDDDVKATAGSNDPTAGARKTQALPAKGAHAIQLYSLGTPNGVKVSILLEELNDLQGVEYDAWKINFGDLDQFGSGFVEVNPNSKIPAMLDYDVSPPVRVFESGSILLYLAEKYGAFLPADVARRVEAKNWLFWQVGGGPSMGALGHFKNVAPVKLKYAVDRFALETKRQLSVLEQHLARDDMTYVAGSEYSIADIAIWPWIRTLLTSYKAGEFLDFAASYPHVQAWYDKIADRPAVQRGVRVLGFGENALPERHSKADF